MTEPFLRPGASDWLRRWRETLAAAAVAALGILWFTATGGVLAWFGVVLAFGAVGAAVAALRRAMFLSPGGGVGVVHLDEGRLTYFGPLSGGSVAVREIVSVGMDPRHKPTHWVIRDATIELLIPVDAEGAGVLLDVFALLPGLDLGSTLSASARVGKTAVTLWRRDGADGPARRLVS